MDRFARKPDRYSTMEPWPTWKKKKKRMFEPGILKSRMQCRDEGNKAIFEEHEIKE
jgi:hypothetical protein